MAKIRSKKLNDSLKLLARTSFIVLIGIFLSKLISYIYRIIIARYFGPEGYGIFSLALIVSGWFIAISALGLSDGLLRFISFYRGRKELGKARYLFKLSIKILSISSVISGVLLFFASDFIALNIFSNAELANFLRIFSIIIPITVLSYPFLAAIRAYERIAEYSFIYNIFQNAVRLIFLIFFIYLGLMSSAITLSYLIGMFGLLVMSYIVCRKKIPELFMHAKISTSQKLQSSRDLFKYSLPLLLFGLIATIFYWIDSASIGYLKGVYEVGIYNVAVPIALLLSVTPELFMQMFFPMINKEYAKKNTKLIEELSKQIAKWILIVNLPAFILLIFFPGAAINLLFGSEYLVAENALRILAIGAFVSSMFIISNQLISMIGKSKLILSNIIIASIINLILNFIFIPMDKIWFLENSLGINGAAIATLISLIVLNLLFVVQARSHLNIIPLRRKMFNVVLSLIIPASILFYLKSIVQINVLSIIMLTLLFLLLYVLFLVIFKCLDRNDILIIKAIKSKLSYFSPSNHS